MFYLKLRLLWLEIIKIVKLEYRYTHKIITLSVFNKNNIFKYNHVIYYIIMYLCTAYMNRLKIINRTF